MKKLKPKSFSCRDNWIRMPAQFFRLLSLQFCLACGKVKNEVKHFHFLCHLFVRVLIKLETGLPQQQVAEH